MVDGNAGVFGDGHACLDIGALSNSKRPGELMRCVCSWATVETELDAFITSMRKHAVAAATTTDAGAPAAAEGGGGSVEMHLPTSSAEATPTSLPLWPGLNNVRSSSTPHSLAEPWVGCTPHLMLTVLCSVYNVVQVPVGTKGAFRHRIVQPHDAAGSAGSADTANNESEWLPIFCVRGGNPHGPVLLTLAGVHGDEFEPMAASQDLYGSLDPAKSVTHAHRSNP